MRCPHFKGFVGLMIQFDHEPVESQLTLIHELSSGVGTGRCGTARSARSVGSLVEFRPSAPAHRRLLVIHPQRRWYATQRV